jgi:hypothetical protein
LSPSLPLQYIGNVRSLLRKFVIRPPFSARLIGDEMAQPDQLQSLSQIESREFFSPYCRWHSAPGITRGRNR